MRNLTIIFRNRALRIVLSFAAVAVAALVGSVWYYGNLDTVPSGISVSGWEIGGSELTVFYAELQKRAEQAKARKIVFNSDRPNVESATTTAGELGMQTNAGELFRAISSYREGSFWERARTRWSMRDRTYTLEAHWPEEALATAVARIWRDSEEKQPKPAQRIITSSDTIRYEREVPVARIDRITLGRILEEKANAAIFDNAPIEAQLPLYMHYPNVTVETLKAQGIERKIIEFSTRLSNSGEGRRYNIRETATTIHDMTLKPGEVFSYEKAVKETRSRVGYKNAPIILNGKIVPGLGGGICQVSTTLYNAVLRTGLEIVERRNHSLPISYAPMGQDATFSTGYIDFQFRNSSQAHLLIRSELKGNTLTVKLFGSLPANVRYTIESKVVETIRPPKKFVHNPSLAKGQEQVLQSGKQGYIVVTTRTKYVDGKKVSTEQISKDRYQPKPMLVARNGGANVADDVPNGGRKPIIEDGVEGPSFD